MKIVTLNVNGIRSAAKKGFFTWMVQENPDIICLQEIRVQMEDIKDPIFHPAGYHGFFYTAEKKGYSGVAIYTKQKPDNEHRGLGWAGADKEGRYLQIGYGDLSIASVYLPSGSAGPHRQVEKFNFMDRYLPFLKKQKKDGRRYILCGDFNIAHKPIDLKNWRSNQKNSGFLPEERAWLDELFEKIGFVDAFRVVNQGPDQYTWWSNFGQAWAKNIGWRIDYQVVTPDLLPCIKNASIYKEERFSDHAPLIMEYQL